MYGTKPSPKPRKPATNRKKTANPKKAVARTPAKKKY